VDPDEVDHLAETVSAGRPVVLIDRTVTALQLDGVGIDNRQATHDAIARLISLGHRRIGMISGAQPRVLARALRQESAEPAPGETPSEGRLVGYCQGLREAGLGVDHALVVDGGFHSGQAREAARTLLSIPDRPTAVLTTDSLLTIGALQAIRDLGLACPQEVSLLGFDDADWASLVEPPITVISQPAYEIGARAAEFLLARIADGSSASRRVQLPTTLIERGSVAAIPAG
jgi:LacI family transcriptional regulator